MKKWSVLAIVAIFAVVMILQYALKKRTGAGGPGTAEEQVGEVGVALPADGGAPPAATPDLPASSARRTAPATYGPLPTFPGEAAKKGECEKGSLNNILSDHGKIWGLYLETVGFPQPQVKEIYALASKYFACVALARRDASVCNYLPAAGISGGHNIPFQSSPNFACRRDYADIGFAAMLAGKSKDETPCRIMIANGALENSSSVAANDFCAAASKGVDGFCSSFSKAASSKELKACMSSFPPSSGSCGGAPQCLGRSALFSALEADDADGCPAGYRDFCRAYLSKADSSCSALLKELSATYCRILDKSLKETGGTLGLSKVEVENMAIAKKRSEQRLELLNKQIRAANKSKPKISLK